MMSTPKSETIRSSQSAIPDLFTPVKLGPYELKNRIVMVPLTRNRAGGA